MLADTPPRNGANGHGAEGRTEGRRTSARNINAAQTRHDGQRVHIRRLALVRAHAKRSVALQVLDIRIAFLMRLLHVLQRHIILKIDKGLPVIASFNRHPCGLYAVGTVSAYGGELDLLAVIEVKISQRLLRGLHPVADRSQGAEMSQHTARPEMSFRKSAGHERRDPWLIAGLYAAMGCEMHSRIPSAAHT